MKNKQIPTYNVELNDCSVPTKSVKNYEIHLLEELLTDIEHVSFPHRHAFYNLLFVTGGTGTHTVDFREHEVKPNRIFFMTEGQIHSWNLSADISGYTIFFDKEFYRLYFGQKAFEEFPFFHSDFSAPYLDLAGEHLEQVQQLFDRLFLVNKEKTTKKLPIWVSYLNILMLRLAEVFQPVIGGNTSTSYRARDFELLLHDHFTEFRSVTEYAKRLNVTPNYLNALVQEAYGKSAKELINERIVLEIKRLLHNSDLTVSEIAYSLSFSDAAYLTRFFKKQTDLTPEAFRKVQSAK